MNQFNRDDRWQRECRDQFLKPFYSWLSSGRFVFLDRGPLVKELQTQMHVDTFLQDCDGYLIGIDEKLVRWPGYEYTHYTLETQSCTVPGRLSKGWMYSSKCDLLVYCFQRPNDRCVVHTIPFKNLQTWFFESSRFSRYERWVSDQINRTECYKVPIADVFASVPNCRKYELPLATLASAA